MRVNSILAKILIKSISPKIKCYTNDEDNYYEPGDDSVHICPVEYYLPSFTEHLYNTHQCSYAYDFPQIYWSILHEVGHYYTDDPGDEEDIYIRLLNSLEDEDHLELTDQEYYDLDSEYDATEWAIEYIQKHPIKSKIFGKLFKLFTREVYIDSSLQTE